jgi:hypothetical protein
MTPQLSACVAPITNDTGVGAAPCALSTCRKAARHDWQTKVGDETKGNHGGLPLLGYGSHHFDFLIRNDGHFFESALPFS